MAAPIKTLIIDDRESDVDFLRLILRQAEQEQTFQVAWESDQERALERLRTEPFDLVLLDYQMPVVNGLDLLPKLRRVNPSVPIIMLTGQGNEAVAVQAIKRGAHDYLRKDDLTVPALLCTVMTALERRRLEEELAREREAHERDLQLARELQQAFLPESLPHFSPSQRPDQLGLRLYHRYTPTLAVGGDFFDVLPVDEHAAGVFIADIAGHGLQAALVTAVLRTLIEENKELAGDPAGFLQQLNSGLHRILRQTTNPIFASAFYLMVDLREGRASFSSAAHPPQLHLRRSAEEVTRLVDLSRRGPMLGVEEEAVFAPHVVMVDPRDLFLLFTNDLLEVSDAQGRPFGLTRLETILRHTPHAPANQLVEQIVTAARQHCGETLLPEELCVLAVEASQLASSPPLGSPSR